MSAVGSLRATLRSVSVAALLICLAGCNAYDPLIGGRNPRPGAERYLSSRKDISAADKTAFLDSKPCSPELLAQLADAPSREVRSLVAANPSVSVATMEKLLHDKEPGVRGFMAINPKAPHAILLKLKSDPDYDVGWMLPGNPNWRPEEIREMYGRMRKEQTRPGTPFTSASVFAGNPSTPPDILEELAMSDSYFVQGALANNPSIPPGAAQRLANAGDASVKTMLIRNKATPKAVIRALTSDPNPEVRSAAIAALRN